MGDKLPVEAIVRESIRRTIERRRELVRLCWPYIVLAFLTSAIAETSMGAATGVVMTIAFVAFSVLAAINCHRVFLLSEAEAKQLGPLRWSKRETRFLLNAIGIAVMMAVISIPSMFVYVQLIGLLGYEPGEESIAASLLSLILFLPVYYFVARWSLILPDAALDIGRDLSWAWRLSRGHGAQLLVVIGVVPMLISLALGLVALLVGDLLVFQLAQAAIWVAVAAFEICLLSLSYEWLNRYSDAGQPDAAGPTG